jgi:predicted extracellular nuclease
MQIPARLQRTLAVVFAALLVTGPLARRAFADLTAQSLPFSQDWSDAALITANNDWSLVPGITGYRGDGLTSATGVDPQTVLADGAGTPVNVIANQSNTNLTTGGVAEFDGLANPTIALQGSGTARAPHIVLVLNTLGQSNVQVSYNLRDIDGTADNAVQPVALHYRIGAAGDYTNIPAAFVADATEGPSLATKVTPVSVTLPAACDNQPQVFLRILTTDAAGSDEWVGIDDIVVTTATTPTLPSAVTSATPSSVQPGGVTLLAASVTPGANPASTGLAVRGDLTSVGGSATQPFFDDGTNGDLTAGDRIFSYALTVPGGTLPGPRSIPLTIADAQGRTAAATVAFTISPQLIPISQIQGPGDLSPVPNGTVVLTQGIVTARKSNGFFIQTPDGQDDGNPATSEGLFVFTSSTPPAAATPGNLVQVSGALLEFRPNSDPNSPTLTELTAPLTITTVSTGNPLPAPVTLSPALLNPQGPFNQLERLESMRVSAPGLTVVSPTGGSVSEPNATATTNGTFFAVLEGTPRPFREPGIAIFEPLPAGAPATVPRWDTNPEAIRIISNGQPGSAALDVSTGATVSIPSGVLDFGSRAYTILPDPTPAATASGGRVAQPVPAPAPEQLTIASMNIERLFDTTDDPSVGDPILTPTAFQNRLAKISLVIRNVLRSPDIIGLQEVENLATLQALAARLNADSAPETPNYTAYLEEGNDPGGIDVGFLVKTSRVSVLSVTQEGMTTTYIDPNTGNPAILNDRPPLILRARASRPGSDQPVTFTVIVNHLRSLTSIDSPTDGNRVRTKRRAQAEFLASLVQARQSANPQEPLIVLGDMNAFEINDGYVDSIGAITGQPAPPDQVVLPSPDLVNPNLTNLLASLPPEQRYSYLFGGSAQTLDHILLNVPAQALLSGAAYSRSNADFAQVLRNDPATPVRISDHDHPVAYLTLPGSRKPIANPQTIIVPFGGSRTFTLSVSDPDGDALTLATRTAPARGTVAYNNAARTATYTAQPAASGGDTFTYTATDPSGLSADGTVTVLFDIDSQVNAVSTGLVYDRQTGVYEGSIRLIRTGPTTLQGPFHLVLRGLPAGVTLLHPSGTFEHAPCITLTGSIGPGRQLITPVRFTAPPNTRIGYTVQTLSGPF